MIRPARADEADVLLRIQREASVAGFPHVFPPDRYPFPDDAIRSVYVEELADPEIDVYVAEDGDAAVGTVSVGGGRLRALYVLPSHWSRGIGSSLHDHALARLAALGHTEARLWALTENAPARAFYERRGWTTTGRTRVVPFPPNPLDVEYVRPL